MKPFGSVFVAEIGRVRFRNRNWILGVACLKRDGVRGRALLPKRKCLPGVIVISNHLPIDGPMITEAIIHETLHVAFPRQSEQAIERGANLVAKVLRKFEGAKRKARNEV